MVRAKPGPRWNLSVADGVGEREILVTYQYQHSNKLTPHTKYPCLSPPQFSCPPVVKILSQVEEIKVEGYTSPSPIVVFAPCEQAFQWVRASLGQPGLFVGPGRVQWAGLNVKWAWAGLGPEVLSPGDPAGLAHLLSLVSNFHDPSSHSHYGN